MVQDRRAARLRASLEHAFAPAEVVVHDRSAQHAGHAGAADAGETHYDVTIITPWFEGVGRVGRSRAVHEVLAAEFASGLHALSLTLRTPSEQASSPVPRT